MSKDASAEDAEEEEEEFIVKPQKAKKGVATKITRAQRDEPAVFDLPTSGTSGLGLSPPTTTANAGRARKPTAAKSVSRTGSSAPRARPHTTKSTQNQSSFNPAPAPARPGPPADRFQPSGNRFSKTVPPATTATALGLSRAPCRAGLDLVIRRR